MMFPTHVVTTAATTAYLMEKWNVTGNKWMFAIGFVAGAIPDCDLIYYMLKKKPKNKQFTADAVNHRQTYLHAPLFHLAVLTPLFVLASLFHLTTFYQVLVLLSIGVFSHILLDMVWIGGVPLLYPFQKGLYGFFLKHSRRQLQEYIDQHGNDWFGFYMQHPLFYFECCFLAVMAFSKIVSPEVVIGSTLFFAVPALAIQLKQKRRREQVAQLIES